MFTPCCQYECTGLVVVYQTDDHDLTSSALTGLLQATLRKLLTYCVLGPTQPPTLSGMGNE